MSLVRLQIFQCVARERSFAAAAETLRLTGSAVSQQMAQLEAELGVALLIRTSRGTELTEAGRALLQRVDPMLAEVRNVHADLPGPGGAGANLLRLGCPLERLLARIVRALDEEVPELDVQLTVDSSDALVELVADGLLDVAVAFDPDRPHGVAARASAWAQVRVDRLAEDPFVAVLPAGHPAAGRPVTVEDIGDLVLVGCPTDPGMGAVAEACRAAGVRPRFMGHDCRDYESMLALVRIEEALALMPRLATLGRADGLSVAPLTWSGPSRRLLLIGQDRELQPAQTRSARVIAGTLTAV